MSTAARDLRLLTLGRPLGVDSRFLLDEVEYALGRFLPEDLNSYLVVRREGRGQAPRMERPLRERLLNEVIAPYQRGSTATASATGTISLSSLRRTGWQRRTTWSQSTRRRKAPTRSARS